MSFGGWSFSTEQDTYPIFRQGVTGAQRQAFAANVANFVKAHGLDGVDFDWEYPGAPDIPDIPPGDPDDGYNYLAFLQWVRVALGSSYQIAIAAPASYWYLRGFPIKAMSNVVDYIVYMTYDLHGQWDYDNEWSSPGCPGGNCLRSHINKTETTLALAMITHAGVPASKVIVGMALYGRSFKMTAPGCYGPDCTFTGPLSGATKGRCTDTAGYLSNYEIRDIISYGSGFKTHYSDDEGDILVYNNVQWVSYMKRETYANRLAWIRGLNFGGTSDWAADLDADYPSGAGPGQGNQGSGPVYVSPDIYGQPNPLVSCFPPCTLVLPPWVLPSPTTISFPPVTVSYLDTWSTILTVGGVVVTTSASSITSTVLTLPSLTTQTIPVSNVVWSPSLSIGAPGTTTTSTTVGGVIWLTSSIVPPPVTITKTHTRYPGGSVVWTYSPGPFPPPPTNTGPPPLPPPIPPPPPPGSSATVQVRSGSPSPTCRPLQICGWPCVIGCTGWKIPCLGVCGCIGPLCSWGGCVGLGCVGGGGGGGGCVGAGCSDPGPNPDSNPNSCQLKQTASLCQVGCTVMQYPASTTTVCKDPECTRTFTACTATDSTTTTTKTFSCSVTATYDAGNLDDEVGILGDGGYGGTIGDYGNFNIPPQTVTVTSVVTVHVPVGTTTTTRVVTVEPDAYAECAFWDFLFFLHFNIYNIMSNNGWVDRVESELRGCGALTGWTTEPRAGSNLGRLWFNLPTIMSGGCVERAIVSAGGPKLSCSYWGFLKKNKNRSAGGTPAAKEEAVVPRPRRPAALPKEKAAVVVAPRQAAPSTYLYTQTPTPHTITETPTYSYPPDETIPAYVPMVWGAGGDNTVTLTWTLTSTSTSSSVTVYTTIIPGYPPETATSTSTSEATTSSTTSAAPPSGPTTSPGNAGYELHGCYTELTSGRALPFSSADDDMTVAACLALGTGYTYVGLQYGRECYWGNTLGAGSVEDSAAACNMPCAGDAGTLCGAGNRLTLYLRKAGASEPPSPYVPSVGGYDLVGCYAEPPGGRALTLSSADDAMTPAMCAGVAAAASVTYFGVEYGRECWYGNTIASGAVLQSGLESCDMACAGDAAKKCGAGNRLLMYELA